MLSSKKIVIKLSVSKKVADTNYLDVGPYRERVINLLKDTTAIAEEYVHTLELLLYNASKTEAEQFKLNNNRSDDFEYLYMSRCIWERPMVYKYRASKI